jgi:hypothetical protein
MWRGGALMRVKFWTELPGTPGKFPEGCHLIDDNP